MDDAKQQLTDKLKNANNILVTVSRDPSVDQLASCIGLTLLLNKLGKHAAAVFSGKVPSTLEFLQPEETLEKNTDSLRDFIISLDKSKADKLRYKVEEDVVRIFITPYKTSLSQDDLEFSEGDFNVDVVVALGVGRQEDLDEAITAHGRILHDATVTSINAAEGEGGLGSINWNDPQASSLSELVTDLSRDLGEDLLDEQIATSLLTGIISETGRFSNDRTSSQTMSASALLLDAGANQQLVASELEAGQPTSGQPAGPVPAQPSNGTEGDDSGMLQIDHMNDAKGQAPSPEPIAQSAPAPTEQPPAGPPPETPPAPDQPGPNLTPGAELVTEPPKLGGTLTANSQAEHLDPVTDPLSMPGSEPPALLDHKDKPAPPPPEHAAPESPTPPVPTPDDKATLSEIEKSVDSPHLAQSELDQVRGEVNKALAGADLDEPIEALNAQPLGGELHEPGAPPAAPEPAGAEPADTVPGEADAEKAEKAEKADKKDSDAPPPVPPPIPFQFGNSGPPQ